MDAIQIGGAQTLDLIERVKDRAISGPTQHQAAVASVRSRRKDALDGGPSVGKGLVWMLLTSLHHLVQIVLSDQDAANVNFSRHHPT